LLPSLLAALPDFALGLLCVTAWVAPEWIGVQWIRYVVLLMLMEFIVIHSSGFMGAAVWGSARKAPRGLVILGFGAFYTLFVGGFALVFKTWAPLVGFWVLTLNRLLGAVVGQADGKEKALVMRGWAACTLFYLLVVFATTLLPVPRLGVTPEIAIAANIPGDSGLWVTRPYTVLAAGFVYFTACAVSELSGHRWLPISVEGSRRGSKAVEGV